MDDWEHKEYPCEWYPEEIKEQIRKRRFQKEDYENMLYDLLRCGDLSQADYDKMKAESKASFEKFTEGMKQFKI